MDRVSDRHTDTEADMFKVAACWRRRMPGEYPPPAWLWIRARRTQLPLFFELTQLPLYKHALGRATIFALREFTHTCSCRLSSSSSSFLWIKCFCCSSDWTVKLNSCSQFLLCYFFNKVFFCCWFWNWHLSWIVASTCYSISDCAILWGIKCFSLLWR